MKGNVKTVHAINHKVNVLDFILLIYLVEEKHLNLFIVNYKTYWVINIQYF